MCVINYCGQIHLIICGSLFSQLFNKLVGLAVNNPCFIFNKSFDQHAKCGSSLSMRMVRLKNIFKKYHT